jgi:hypothetical protein
MAYTCIDCSYKGNKFVNGSCPACGSRNVKRLKVDADEAEKPPARPYRLIAAVILWLVFIVELYKKLSV